MPVQRCATVTSRARCLPPRACACITDAAPSPGFAQNNDLLGAMRIFREAAESARPQASPPQTGAACRFSRLRGSAPPSL